MSKKEQEGSLETENQTEAKEIVKALEEGPQDDYERYLRSENGRVLYNSPSSIWNLLFFSETNKILNYGEKHRYEFDSLFRVNSDLTHKEISPELNKQYSEALKKDPNASYYEQVFKVVRKNQMTGACVFGSAFICQLFNPPLLKWYLTWLQDEGSDYWKGWVYLVFLLAISYSKPFFTQNAVHYLHSGSLQTEILNRVRKFFQFEI